MYAAEDLSVGFNAVSHDSAVTVRTNRSKRVNRALEAVERVVLPGDHNFKRLVIVVFANFAFSHTQISSGAMTFAAVFPWFRESKFCSSRADA